MESIKPSNNSEQTHGIPFEGEQAVTGREFMAAAEAIEHTSARLLRDPIGGSYEATMDEAVAEAIRSTRSPSYAAQKASNSAVQQPKIPGIPTAANYRRNADLRSNFAGFLEGGRGNREPLRSVEVSEGVLAISAVIRATDAHIADIDRQLHEARTGNPSEHDQPRE